MVTERLYTVTHRVLTHLAELDHISDQQWLKDDELRKHTISGIIEATSCKRSSLYPAIVTLLDGGLIIKGGKVQYGPRKVEYYNITAKGSKMAGYIREMQEVGLV